MDALNEMLDQALSEVAAGTCKRSKLASLARMVIQLCSSTSACDFDKVKQLLELIERLGRFCA
jgi:hypothetical protein